MKPFYDDLDEVSQVEALRPVALAAAADFGLEVDRMEVVLHAYNTTFRVDTADGRRVALRVNTNSSSTPAQIRVQQAWQHALATQTDVLVPDPLQTGDGAWFATVESADLGRTALATASSWLEGDDLGTELDPEQAHALGAAMARLHDHAEVWGSPADADLRTFSSPLFGDPDVLTGWAGYDDAARATIAEATARSTAAFDRVYAGQPLILLHADLHGGNLKWHEGRLAVFDFDDAGLGVPALDLAISTFYLPDRHGEVESALRAGYAAYRPLPEISPPDLEALVAGRQLLLANDLLRSTTQGMRQQSAAYAATTITRLDRWLRSGVFSRTVGA